MCRLPFAFTSTSKPCFHSFVAICREKHFLFWKIDKWNLKKMFTRWHCEMELIEVFLTSEVKEEIIQMSLNSQEIRHHHSIILWKINHHFSINANNSFVRFEKCIMIFCKRETMEKRFSTEKIWINKKWKWLQDYVSWINFRGEKKKKRKKFFLFFCVNFLLFSFFLSVDDLRTCKSLKILTRREKVLREISENIVCLGPFWVE